MCVWVVIVNVMVVSVMIIIIIIKNCLIIIILIIILILIIFMIIIMIWFNWGEEPFRTHSGKSPCVSEMAPLTHPRIFAGSGARHSNLKNQLNWKIELNRN